MTSLAHSGDFIRDTNIIQGIECYGSTAETNNPDGSCWFISRYKGFIDYGCDLDGRPGMGDVKI